MYDYDRRTAAVVDMDLAKTYADAWSNDLIGRLAPRFLSPAKLGEVLRGQWFDLVGAHARSLEWRSSQWMAPSAWASQMQLVCPEYNMFHAGKVGAWLALIPGVEVQPAREHSVTLYLRGSPEALAKVEWQAKKAIHADVVDMQADGTLRLWWD